MFITGTDEVGRGCIAGPIVAASFGLYLNDLIDLRILLEKHLKQEQRSLHKKRIQRTISILENDINLATKHAVEKSEQAISPNYNTEVLQFVFDSKKISEKYRATVTQMLTNNSNYGLGVISNKEIDKSGLQNANRNAMSMSLKHLQYWSSTGPVLHLFDQVGSGDKNYMYLTKGDQNSFVIAAASIIAKTYRDELMDEYDKLYPKYGFKNHVGYGTKDHLKALKVHGPSPIHRLSYNIFD